MSGLRNIAEHIEDAQNASLPGRWPVPLHVGDRTKDFRTANRYAVSKGLERPGFDPEGTQLSWDEYPFASSMEGGNPDAVSLRLVPLNEQWIQGGVLNKFYNENAPMPGDCFYVKIEE